MIGFSSVANCIALTLILITAIPLSANAGAFPKYTFSLDEVSFCSLLENKEVETATKRKVIKTIPSPYSCEWKLAPKDKSDSPDDEIRVIARTEQELPKTVIGLEGVKGQSLSKTPGAADLYLTEIDPNIKGVHSVCGFYLFSLEMRLHNIDYQKVGKALGVVALWRFNEAPKENTCFADSVIPSQYPDFKIPQKSILH
ncbi:MAG: hypothetical protein P4M13_07640 [Alphaproteobacteria bacterium]|nr:hypothetical protein [Alphaproteobacteria bacterium]